MKSIMIIVSFSLFQIKACQNEMFIDNSSFQVFEGLIAADDNSSKIYLQDHEDGNFIELKFYYDNPEWIDFDEFTYVEVKGYYNDKKKAMLVEELYPLTKDKRKKASKETLASIH